MKKLSTFYVTGGSQRKNALEVDEWFSYGLASIYSFDSDTGQVAHCVDYNSTDNVRPDDENANIVFKAGSRKGNNLLVCTQTEIIEYSLPDFKQINHISHPWLNDAHHVVENSKGNIFIANTGLDMVLELNKNGDAINDYSTIPGECPWDRFDQSIDYRKVITTKPHHCHPNYVFEYKDEIWVSRFIQKDLLCLSNPKKRIEIGLEKTHDGNVFNDKVYCTTVNGFVFISDLKTQKLIEKYDLNEITKSTKDLGWCRSLHVIDEDRIIVGFSRLRPSKIRENLRWVKFQMGLRETSGRLPTRVACFNLKKRTLDWTVDLEKHGMNAVFSIIPG